MQQPPPIPPSPAAPVAAPAPGKKAAAEKTAAAADAGGRASRLTNPQKLALLKQVLQEGAHVAVHGKIISSWAAVHATMKEHESFSSPAGSAAIKVPVAETLRSEAEREMKEYTGKEGAEA